jgi:transcriptional regulator with XRE-family HTH domain
MNAIERLRIKAGLSQADLAKALNITQGAVSQWENSGTLPRSDKIPELARALKCSIDDLYNIEST